MPSIVVQEVKQKNQNGKRGPICNNCGGFGYTLNLMGGGSNGCGHCGQSGIAQLSIAELNQLVNNLAMEVQGLKNIIVKLSKERTL